MSFDKAIEYEKEHRKKYRGAKAVAKSARNHGDDSWAYEDRTHRNTKRQVMFEEKVAEVDTWVDSNGRLIRAMSDVSSYDEYDNDEYDNDCDD